MKKILYLVLTGLILTSCSNNGNDDETERDDTVTNAVQNAEGAENNAYNLPGDDTGAIHDNTTTPGVLDKDARDTSDRQQ